MNPLPAFVVILLALPLATRGADAPPAPPAPTPPAPAAPARRAGPPPVRSPEVAADHRVTFRVRAPKATEVQVGGQWSKERAAMTQDTNGVWSVTVGPIEPGVYEYSFHVDGLTMIDPGNPAIKPMREPRTSILHLPGQPPRIHDFQAVPHGTVSWHTYASKALNRPRDLAVYTPPNYGQDPAARFPLLVLQHGSGDNHATWTVHGKAHWILDNLIAQGRARPMVVMMLDGHAAVAGGPGAPGANTTAFERDLLEDALPLVEAAYRVQAGPEHRAIVGLSMGGGQSLTIGLNHLDQFGWVGGFSASVPDRATVASALDHPDAANGKLKLLWIACGRDDFLLQRNEAFITTLKEQGLRHEWHLTEGDHSWPIWRGYLADFLPRLFQ